MQYMNYHNNNNSNNNNNNNNNIKNNNNDKLQHVKNKCSHKDITRTYYVHGLHNQLAFYTINRTVNSRQFSYKSGKKTSSCMTELRCKLTVGVTNVQKKKISQQNCRENTEQTQKY